jgi:tRNA pseudouridine55 synthase
MSGSRRGLDGPPRLLCVDKPVGPTSFDVVRAVRKITGYRRVGHAGTLDPFATGLLVIGLGSATRLLRFVSDAPKVYEAEVEFGSETDTEDCTGEVVAHSSRIPDEATLRTALPVFIGRIEQVPPAFSAVHIDGERSYRRARRGESVQLPSRVVEILEFELTGWAAPRASLRIRCGSGTYVRALGRDLGRHLGSAAHLTRLRRTESAGFEVARAIPLHELAARWESGERGLAPGELVRGWPRVELDADRAVRVRQGLQPDAGWWADVGWRDVPDRVALLDGGGGLVAIAAREPDGRLRLELVLPEVG